MQQSFCFQQHAAASRAGLLQIDVEHAPFFVYYAQASLSAKTSSGNLFDERPIRQPRSVCSKLPPVCRNARSGFGVLAAAAHRTVCAGGGACADTQSRAAPGGMHAVLTAMLGGAV